MNNIGNNNRSGFSLVELSIVLVIAGLMITATLTVVSMQLDAANITQTKDKLNKIERALQLYYDTSGHLPCPAAPNLASSHLDFAKSQNNDVASDDTLSNATCSSGVDIGLGPKGYRGVVPTRTLDLPDDFLFDAWGNRISYVVSKKCIDPDNWLTLSSNTEPTYTTDDPTTTSPHGCVEDKDPGNDPGGELTVSDNNSPPLERTLNAVYVVISHGKNGLGSYNRVGTRVTNGASVATAAELDNASLNSSAADVNNEEFRDDRIIDFDGATNYYDDLVRWKTGAQVRYENEN